MPAPACFTIKDCGKMKETINFKDIVCIQKGYKTPNFVQFKEIGKYFYFFLL